jgi:hypothetical protein
LNISDPERVTPTTSLGTHCGTAALYGVCGKEMRTFDAGTLGDVEAVVEALTSTAAVAEVSVWMTFRMPPEVVTLTPVNGQF